MELSSGVMGSGGDVVLACVAVASWIYASKYLEMVASICIISVLVFINYFNIGRLYM